MILKVIYDLRNFGKIEEEMLINTAKVLYK